VRIAAFESRLTLDSADRDQVSGKTQQQLLADIDVGDFSAAELDHCFNSIPFLEEADGVVSLEVVIVIVRIRAELDFLDLDDVLLPLGVVLLLFVFVLPLPIIHGLGHRRLGSGRDQDQVQSQVLRLPDGHIRGHDFDGAIGKYGANFARTDCLVYVFPDLWPAGWESSWNHPRAACNITTTGESIMTK